MIEDSRFDHVWVVGPGRLGLAMAGLLASTNAVAKLTVTGRSPSPPRHPLFESSRAVYSSHLRVTLGTPTLVIIAVPDSEIGNTATALAGRNLAPVPVLHTSGVLNSSVLAPLAARGYPTGSLHPMVAVSDPIQGSGSLSGAWFGIEGSSAAMDAAERIVALVKGHPLHVDASGKPGYHTAAVFASNYVVVLLDLAERLMMEAGVDRRSARGALTSLALGAVENVSSSGPAEALTGPVSRGDQATIATHLRGLSLDLRPLYSELARRALDLATRQGLDAERARSLSRTLEAEAV